MAGIYIHIPFCKQACHYCDFHFTISQRYKPDLIEALGQELEMQSSYIEGTFDSIYFGGGTPSILEFSEIKYLMETICSHYAIGKDPEITLEVNPDDLQKDFLKEVHSLGINRLSIGLQTFDDEMLLYMNRAHRSVQARNGIVLARKVGFDNLNLDLIFGLPSSGHQRLEYDLKEILSFSPEHISAYCLTIEEKTLFGKWLKQGKLEPVDENFAAEQFEIVHSLLSARGYQHYEISNYALNGFQSRHNGNYWKDKKYLGIGPSAHSYNGASRQFNVANNLKYIASIREGEVPFTLENLGREERINDYILTSIRTAWGCSFKKLEREMGYRLEKEKSEFLASILSKELAIVEDNVLILTPKGMLLADTIASNLFV